MSSRHSIRSLDSIRMLVRDFFVFGCFSEEDYVKKGISKRKYHADKNKLLSIIQGEHFDEDRVKGQKVWMLRMDVFETNYNYLMNMTQLKSLDSRKGSQTILILQLLSLDPSDFYSIEEILDQLNAYMSEMIEADDRSVMRLLDELVNFGWLEKKKSNKKNVYRLKKTLYQDLESHQVKMTRYFLDLFRHICYPTSIGNSLFELFCDLDHEKIRNVVYESPFIYKHHYLTHTLDDEIIWNVLEAIDRRFYVNFDYDQNQGESIIKVRPIRVIMDQIYGRRYIFGVVSQTEEYHYFRVDKISNLTIGDQHSYDYQSDLMNAREKMGYSYTGATLAASSFFEVEIKCDSERTAQLLVTRFYRLAPQMINKEDHLVKLIVNDTRELKPLLRSFVGRIEIMSNSNHTLKEDMDDELLEWRELYGVRS